MREAKSSGGRNSKGEPTSRKHGSSEEFTQDALQDRTPVQSAERGESQEILQAVRGQQDEGSACPTRSSLDRASALLSISRSRQRKGQEWLATATFTPPQKPETARRPLPLSPLGPGMPLDYFALFGGTATSRRTSLEIDVPISTTDKNS